MNEIALISPNSLFYLSRANEAKKTLGDISDLGKKLAWEVSEHLQSFDEDGNMTISQQVKRITFIGFSLGGLIIRACLPHLEPYKDKMHGFVTLSSPHLGYTSHQSNLVKSSLWVMEKFVEQGSVKQLNMNDAKDFEDCFLFRLSKNSKLEWFKHIYLFSSVQDKYI